MIKQRDHVLWHKTNGLLRYGLYKGFGRPFGAGVVVNEYPKSGGSWIAQMLAEALDIPFPRNRLPMLGRCLLHGHYLSGTPLKNPVCVFRDGRDVAVSFYYHAIVGNDLTRQSPLEARRTQLGITDAQDIKTNLPKFIDGIFSTHSLTRFTWAEFVEQWYETPGSITVKYEDLHIDSAAELQRVVQGITGKEMDPARAKEIADAFSFKRQSGREAGTEDKGKYLRKGIIGDWQNNFTPEAREVFDRVAGKALIRAGYEPDSPWVSGEDSAAEIQSGSGQ